MVKKPMATEDEPRDLLDSWGLPSDLSRHLYETHMFEPDWMFSGLVCIYFNIYKGREEMNLGEITIFMEKFCYFLIY